ncbi:hypothetical protein FGG08_006261 [Glutinoglossum americanum]|uniref:Uncharacterized protein n=1 Tax=Glutinoglossum americanum TaxID=1670608 RepID=A0A9P8I1V6_9PEZI|nr:hypothetical protein FGG08_006261 [Glutinoglossum americanum]
MSDSYWDPAARGRSDMHVVISIDPSLLPPPKTAPAAKIPWAFACREPNSDSYLLLVDLLPSDAGDVAIKKMKIQYRRLMVSGWTKRITSLFTKTMLGTGVVGVLSPYHAYRSRVRLHVRNYTHNILLTDAFQQPGLLRHIPRFAEPAGSCTLGPVEDPRDPWWLEVVVISRVVDKHKVALLLLSILLIAVSTGIAAGISLRRPDVGVSIASGGFALVSALQALMSYVTE